MLSRLVYQRKSAVTRSLAMCSKQASFAKAPQFHIPVQFATPSPIPMNIVGYNQVKMFSTMQAKAVDIPIIDVKKYFDKAQGWEDECKKVAESFRTWGIVKLQDPRVTFERNEQYLDMVEKYFLQVSKQYYAGLKPVDIRPDFNYQVGATPELVEKARNHQTLSDSLSAQNAMTSPHPPIHDAKWRFFWQIGNRPKELGGDNALPQIIPDGFPDWESQMNGWGNHMVDGCTTAAEMAAIGMGLPADTITKRMKDAPHLLAPTASDLTKFDIGTVFAGFHYDLNFITIHGRSRYPGLFLWTRNMEKFTAVVPDGCLLAQAGIQFERLTGGYIKAGHHEVIYTEKTKEALEKRTKANPNNIPWRISSTLFSHVRSDADMAPIPEMKHLHDKDAAQKYKSMTAGEQVLDELKAINLAI